MLSNSRYKTIMLPLAPKRWWAVLLAIAMSAIWWWQGFEVLSIVALALVLVGLAVGDKFELDAAARRYRVGMHWAHVLNPGWQLLPVVQRVVVKPYSYRELERTRYNGIIDKGMRQVFTVLLSVPHSLQGVVVASIKDKAQAEKIAAVLAETLRVPWHQA